MSDVELVLRALTASQFALLGALLSGARRGDHLAPVGVGACASAIAFVVTSAPGAQPRLGAFWLPLVGLCASKPAWLWLFSRALFADRFALAAREVGVLLAVAGLGVAAEVAPAGSPSAAVASALLGATSLALLVLVPWGLWRDQRADLDGHRRRIRERILPVAALYLAIVVIVQAVIFLRHTPLPPLLVSANLALMWALALAAGFSLVQVRSLDWPTREPPRVAALTPTQHAVLARLRSFVATPRWYADADLSMSGLARRLATNEQTLRVVMREALGMRNFNEWLHRHRLAEAAQRVRSDPSASILAIALDAGYRSIGPFNRAFKAVHGTTPTRMRRDAARGGVGTGAGVTA